MYYVYYAATRDNARRHTAALEMDTEVGITYPSMVE